VARLSLNHFRLLILGAARALGCRSLAFLGSPSRFALGLLIGGTPLGLQPAARGLGVSERGGVALGLGLRGSGFVKGIAQSLLELARGLTLGFGLLFRACGSAPRFRGLGL
jgi:hypothetical protein